MQWSALNFYSRAKLYHFNVFFVLLKTSPENTRAGVYSQELHVIAKTNRLQLIRFHSNVCWVLFILFCINHKNVKHVCLCVHCMHIFAYKFANPPILKMYTYCACQLEKKTCLSIVEIYGYLTLSVFWYMLHKNMNTKHVYFLNVKHSH